MHIENNRIEKQIAIAAPVSRVWRALTDHRQFGEWFRIKLHGPFTAGQPSTGFMTRPGYEHVQWNAVVQKIEPERLFSFTWHPYAVDPNRDYSAETPTLVEFTFEPSNDATILTVVESGFEHIPAERRAECFLRNTNGWTQQMENIHTYVLTSA